MATVTKEGGAVFGADEVFSGTLRGQDLTVYGGFDGEVELKGRLRVARQGKMKAKVKAAAVDVEGEFDGEILTETLTLAETARARGTFVAKRLSVREGALIEGAVNPPGDPRTSALRAPTPSAISAPVPPAPLPAGPTSRETAPGGPSPNPDKPKDDAGETLK